MRWNTQSYGNRKYELHDDVTGRWSAVGDMNSTECLVVRRVRCRRCGQARSDRRKAGETLCSAQTEQMATCAVSLRI